MAKKINHAYGLEQALVKVPHLPVERDSAPGDTDKDYALGDPYVYKIDADNKAIYFFGGLDSSGDPIWVIGGPGASDVDTVNSLSPTAGNIIIDGGTNITDVNSGNTVTLNLNDAITLATSVTSPLYTAGAATDVTIATVAGQDVIIKLGDAAGANKLSVTDNADVEQLAIDSDGSLSIKGDITLNSAGKVMKVTGGAVTDFIGQATLVLGTVTIANTNIAATDKIFIQRQSVAASTSLGVLDVTINAGTSFVISSLTPGTPGTTLTADVSIVDYFIVRQI